jgi:hypothetical protein
MSDLATFMRITGLQVTNEDVDSRKAAVTALKTSWMKGTKQVSEIIAKAAEVAQALGGTGTPSLALGGEVQAIVQKRASAYLHAESPLEVGIVAGLAAIEILSEPPDSSGWLVADVWAAALWSALAFQPTLEAARREELRFFVMDKAKSRSLAGADAARQRIGVPDFGNLSLVDGELEKFADAFKKSTAATIDALRRNAALDREELDFLWWTQLDRTRALDTKLTLLSEPVRSVVAGIEAAAYLRRFPSEAHRDVILRSIVDDAPLTLPELIAEFGEDQLQKLANSLQSPTILAPAAFPLLQAVVSGATNVVGSNIARAASEWGSRALLEAALSKMQAGLPRT